MRKPRVLVQGARYHVTARTNRKELLLDSDKIKELFIDVVSRAKKKYGFRLESICVMGNHVHLIIQPQASGNLSSILQWILSVFAMAWNRIHQQTGHVWGQRFFSKVISGLAEFLHTFLYLDANPVSAGLVDQPEDWKFGGFGLRRRQNLLLLDDPPKELISLLPRHFPVARFT